MDSVELLKSGEIINYNLVCNKGNMLLYSYFIENIKTYKLIFNMKNIDTSKMNLTNLLNHSIYNLLDSINPELIEQIHILKIYNDDCCDILILLKHIAKEIGIKQKYIIFNTKKSIDYKSNTLYFNNKDISLISKENVNKYLESIN